MPKVMSEADIGVVPKRKDSFGNEAFSTKIFEFMTMGVSVIAADTKIDTYYFNKNVITFFESGNEKDLAEKMKLLITNKELRDKQAERALEFVQQNSWQRHRDRYYDLIDTLVETDNRK